MPDPVPLQVGLFYHLVFYIHFNPQKHGFVKDFRLWKWSSYNTVLSHAPTKLQRAEILNWFGGKDRFIEFHHDVVDEKFIFKLIQDDRD